MGIDFFVRSIVERRVGLLDCYSNSYVLVPSLPIMTPQESYSNPHQTLATVPIRKHNYNFLDSVVE